MELKVAVNAERNGVAEEQAAANTGGWWANTTRQTKPAAHRLLKLAQALDEGHTQVGEALTDGRVLLDQAQVIVDAVDALPTDLVPAEVIAEAEEQLVELAAHHDAKELRRLGERILEVLAPEVAEEHERQILEQQEQRARDTARLTMSDDGHGACHGRFKIPTAQGAMLRKHLMALAAPKHRNAAGDADDADDDRNTGRVGMPLRLGQAFMEYIETKGGSPSPRGGWGPRHRGGDHDPRVAAGCRGRCDARLR